MRGGSEARAATVGEVVRVASTSVATSAETTTTAEADVTRGDEKTRDRGHSPIGLSGDGSSSSIESALAPSSKTDQGDDADEFWDAMMSAARVGGGGEDAAGGEDMDMESLSSLVNQARAVRRAGDAGAMTDQERQEAALRVAMQMAALMGIDEDDDA